jgi:hypothetical protein
MGPEVWYTSLMPHRLDPAIISAAESAVEHAQRVRRTHARRTERTTPQRVVDIDMALARLHEAMRPLKSEIGKFRYGPVTPEAEENRTKIRDASESIQRERRKLWKMKNRKVAA